MTAEQYYWYIRRPMLLRQQAMMRVAGNAVQAQPAQQEEEVNKPLVGGRWIIEWSADAEEVFDLYLLNKRFISSYYKNNEYKATWSEDGAQIDITYQKYSDEDESCKWKMLVSDNNLQVELHNLVEIDDQWNEAEEYTYTKILPMRAAQDSLYFTRGTLVATLRWMK